MILPEVVMDWEDGVDVYGGGATTGAPPTGGGRVFFSYADDEETCRPMPAPAPVLDAIDGDRPIPDEPEALRVCCSSLARIG